jgi:peptidoglycan/LPS O-acetylase OafA/YrhL
MKRIALAVFIGYVANALLIAAAEQVLVRAFSDTKYFIADLVTQCLIQVACGYLCARISNTTMALIGLIAVGLLVGAGSLAASWHLEPHWYAVTLLVVYSPCIWLGYGLALRRNPRPADSDRG